MPRRAVVDQLNELELDFVIKGLANQGWTDRELSAAFEREFAKPLSKSAIARWRAKSGNELKERFKFARAVANQLLEDLKKEGSDKYEVIFDDIEDRLLVATRELVNVDPVKMLQLRVEEGKRRIKQEELVLKREALELEKEKLRGARIDRLALSAEFLEGLLEFIGEDPDGLKWFKKNAKKVSAFFEEKYTDAGET